MNSQETDMAEEEKPSCSKRKFNEGPVHLSKPPTKWIKCTNEANASRGGEHSRSINEMSAEEGVLTELPLLNKKYNILKGREKGYGADFEKFMVFFVIVACYYEEDILDFWVASNVEGVFGFDDIVLFTLTKHGLKKLTMVQLKHKTFKKRIKLSDVSDYVFPFKTLKSEDEAKLYGKKKLTNDKMTATKKLIAETGVKEKNKEYFIVTPGSIPEDKNYVKVDKHFKSIFTTNSTGQIFEYICEKEKFDSKFLNNFRILSEQYGVEELVESFEGLSVDDGKFCIIEWIAVQVLGKIFNNHNFIKKNYVQMKNKHLIDDIMRWFDEKQEIFTKKDFANSLSKIALPTLELTKPNKKYMCMKEEQWAVLSEVIKSYQLVIVDNLDLITENFFETKNSHRIISCEDEFIPVMLQCLEMNKELKVIVQISERLRNGLKDKSNIRTCTSVNLNDLSPQLRSQLRNCSVQLQGRRIQFQEVLSVTPDLARDFTVDNLLKLLSGTLTFGEACKTIEYHIPRSIRGSLLKKSIVLKKPKSFFLIVTSDVDKFSTQLKKADSAVLTIQNTTNNTNEPNYCVMHSAEVNRIDEKVKSKIDSGYDSVHILKAHDYPLDFYYELFYSSGNVQQFREFIANDIWTNCPENNIHHFLTELKVLILVAEPGMGKTSLLKSLANKCPSSSWIVFVTLNELNYQKITNFDSYLEHYREQLDFSTKKIFDAHLKNRSVVVLIDGFDEIAPLFVEEVFAIIQGCIESDLKVVVTSREATKKALEEKFNVLSRNISPFSEEDKTKFFENFFENKMRLSGVETATRQIQNFSKEILNKCFRSKWDAKFTGLPLHCYLLAHRLVDECKTFCDSDQDQYSPTDTLMKQLTRINLYKYFIDEKYEIYCNKTLTEKTAEQKKQPTATALMQSKRQKKEFMQKHKDAALQILFPQFGKNISDNFLEGIRTGEENHGIITEVESNGNPMFLHRTFAEYFAALWFVDVKETGTEKIDRLWYFKDELSRPENNVVRDLFDRIMCEDCELHTAIINRDIQEVERLLKRDGGEGNNRCGRSGLHLLAARGATHELVETDIDIGGDIWIEDIQILTREEEEENHLKMLHLLLENGVCDVAADQVFLSTPQQYADDIMALGVIELLLEYSEKNDKLLYDVKNSFLNDVETDCILWTCTFYDYVYIAAQFGRLDSLRRDTADDLLCICAKEDSALLAAKLIEHQGFTTDYLNKLIIYPAIGGVLMLEACSFRSRRIVELLTGKGVSLIGPNKGVHTPMNYAFDVQCEDHKEFLQFTTSFDILKTQFVENVNVLLDGRPALLWAALADNLESVQQLIEAGADVTIKSTDGDTALHLTYKSEIVKLLIEAGAEMNEQDEYGKTALHKAVGQRKYDLVKLLVESGADCDILDREQSTALNMAAYEGREDIFLYLWPRTDRHITQDERFHTILTEDLSQEEVRKKTFVDWPHNLVDLEVLVSAGFYFTGLQDEVKCYKCHCRLFDSGIQRRDVRRDPRCAHVLDNKSQEFISIVISRTCKNRWNPRSGKLTLQIPIRRSGTDSSHGFDFENALFAYLGVACYCQENFKDFWIANNVAGVGAFDDIILYTETYGGEKELLLFQLKHKHNNKSPLPINQFIGHKYLQSFEAVEELVNSNSKSQFRETADLINGTGIPVENFKFIIFTNARVDTTNLNATTKSYFFANKLIYQFKLDDAVSSADERYRSQCYILPRQSDVLHRLNTVLRSVFNDNATFDGYSTAAKDLIDFVRCKKLTILTSSLVKQKISHFVLSKFLRKRIPDDALDTQHMAIWQNISAPYRLVLFHNERPVTDFIALPQFAEVSGNISKDFHQLVSCEENCIDIVLKCLELNENLKVILLTTSRSFASLEATINRYQISAFMCLKDLPTTLRKKLGTCTLQLQGRKIQFQDVLTVAPDIGDIFTVDHVFKLLSQKLAIGEANSEELETYVPRSIRRIFINKSALRFRKRDFFLLLTVDAHVAQHTSYLHSFCNLHNAQQFFETTEQQTADVEANAPNFHVIPFGDGDMKRSTLSNVNGEYESVHILTVHTHGSDLALEWVSSDGNVTALQEFVEKDAMNIEPICEKDFDRFLGRSRKLVLVAEPGMGKTQWLRYFSNECPTDSWVVFVKLNEIDFERITNFKSLLKHNNKHFDSITKRTFDAYLETKAVIVLFDGFDEVAPDFVEEALTITQECDDEELKVVVTSRAVTKNVLEERFKVLSYTVLPFSDEDKIKFFETFFTIGMRKRGFEEADLHEAKPKIQELTRKLLNKNYFGNWDPNFMSVPLHCRLIAESFVNECVDYCIAEDFQLPVHLNMLTLCQRFVDTKFDIYWREKVNLPDAAASQKRLKKQHSDLFVRNHMTAAVQVTFPSYGEKVPEQYVNTIRRGEEKHGIITGVDGNDAPVFVHRTFAEYFAALRLADIYNNGKHPERTTYLKSLMRTMYATVRDLFDRILCKDCELHTAVLDGDKDQVAKLLERDGGEGDNKCGRSALHLLAATGAMYRRRRKKQSTRFYKPTKVTGTEKAAHTEMLELLLSKGVRDVAKDEVLGWTAQQYAEDRKSFGVIDKLLEHSTDTARLYDVDRSPIKEWKTDDLLWMCSTYDYAHIAANFVDLDALNAFEARRLLIKCVHKNAAQFMQKLIQCQGFVSTVLKETIYSNCYDSKGSLLYEACSKGSLSMLRLLASRDADLFARSGSGGTPMDEAMRCTNTELLEHVTSFCVLKARYGDDVNAFLGDLTALQWATRAGNLETMKELLRNDADIVTSVRNSKNHTI